MRKPRLRKARAAAAAASYARTRSGGQLPGHKGTPPNPGEKVGRAHARSPFVPIIREESN